MNCPPTAAAPACRDATFPWARCRKGPPKLDAQQLLRKIIAFVVLLRLVVYLQRIGGLRCAVECCVPSCLDHLRLRSLERASQSSSVPCSLLPLRVVEQHPVWAIGNAHRDAYGPLLLCWDAPELEVLRPPLARHALACPRSSLSAAPPAIAGIARTPPGLSPSNTLWPPRCRGIHGC